ncbi:tetratricopeptide repeat protein [bacterium]|nr:tetratricopeptide repeat protein [Flavobacteriaceae bacterium]MDA9254093.1 tetratricopeptide repeat protein [Flavobacteriaceae bacterium]MDA9302894.1 tetratricopeptide repeat protein [bacterium]MDB4192300.1 tetratricopeptide repeat protein [Flavobacteriaceae bacterium]MDB4207152.1 tetratricopeptide repeat protein [Flavobacteriaceae bacterium]
MKTKVFALVLGLITISTFAQKNELKTADKAIKIKDYSAAMTAVTAAESLLSKMDDKSKAKFYFLKAQAYFGKKDYQTAANTFEKLFSLEDKIGKKRYTELARTIQSKMVQDVYQQASDQYVAKDYKNAANNFYLSYMLSPLDTVFIYNSAVSFSLAKEYESSLNYYKELKDIGYTGITTLYFATSKDSGLKENLGTKGNRDLQVKLGLYKDPVNEQTESKTGDIIKNVAYILKTQGKTEEAIKAVEEAREIYPKDINLILTQADIYFQLKDMKKYGELMELAINIDPTNPQLFFNLGVISFDQGKIEEAKKNYEKAIELKEDYGDAYLNLAVVIMNQEKAIVDEMNNNLSDFDKYDELQEKQRGVHREALPYLEKADKYSRSINTVQFLMNIYQTLEMDEKATKFTDLYKQMRD